MRSFQEIEADIEQSKKQISQYEQEKNSARYSTVSKSIGAAIRALLWGGIAAFFAMLSAGLMEDGKTFKSGEVVSFLCVSAFFLLLSFIASIKYLKRKTRYIAALIFTILSGIIFLEAGVDLLRNLKGISLLNVLFSSYEEQIVKAIGIPMTGFSKCFLFFNSALLVPATLVLIGSVVKFIRETKKKNACKRKEVELSEQIHICQNAHERFCKELEETKIEANRLFSAESAKSTPDSGCIEELARVGLDSAQKWLVAKREEDDRLQGKQIYEEEIKKDQPDMNSMKTASKLGEPRASFWIAKSLTISCLSDYDDYADREIKSIFSEVSEYIKHSQGSDNEKILNVIKALSKILDGKKNYPSAEEISDASQILREMKKTETLSSDDKILTERALKIFISANDSGKTSKKGGKKKTSVDDFEKRYSINEWNLGYVRENAAFCVSWCDILNEKITDNLKSGDYRKAKEIFLDVIEAFDYLQKTLKSFHFDYIVAVTYFMAAGLDIAKGNEWYDDSDRRSLAIQACKVSASYDFETSQAANIAIDLLSSGTSFYELKSAIFPNFPKEIVTKLSLLSEPYEELWKDVSSGAALK